MHTIKYTLRFLPIHFVSPKIDEEQALHTGEELESLVQTLGGTVVDRIIDANFKPEHATYIGKITMRRAARMVKNQKIDVVVLNGMVKARQLFEIKNELAKSNEKIEIWDRVDLILHIFEKHATTTEAKLQIKLARMKYMGPRIYGMGFVLSQQGGGIGTTGAGETNTELMKRHWRSEIKSVNDELDKITKNRADQLQKRKRSGLKSVSIVGYTNAGKSSLFNALTGKNTLVENVLFATLDSTVGKLYLPTLQSEVIISDTIGFIRDLPPRLISAFKSTLMESIHADVVLHVIDLSDPEIDIKISTVNTILTELGKNVNDVMYVFNKLDVASGEQKKYVSEKYKSHEYVMVSAKDKNGLGELKRVIADRLSDSSLLGV